MSTKADQGDLNFDYLGLKKKLSPEKFARYKEVELKVRSKSYFVFIFFIVRCIWNETFSIIVSNDCIYVCVFFLLVKY